MRRLSMLARVFYLTRARRQHARRRSPGSASAAAATQAANLFRDRSCGFELLSLIFLFG
eukprot:m.80929 g.80929  ORF g.80929 m.80929 type:complete len:59 (+) comp50709_c0_seq1:509-685(+)